jgi:hypothetical protein
LDLGHLVVDQEHLVQAHQRVQPTDLADSIEGQVQPREVRQCLESCPNMPRTLSLPPYPCLPSRRCPFMIRVA